MRCPAFDGPGTSARRFRGFFVLLSAFSCALRSLRATCLLSFVLFAPSGAACLPSLALLALSGLPADSLLRSSLSPGYLPTLFCALRSFLCCLPTLLSPSSLSPGVPRPGGPPVCSVMGALLLLFPDSRFPSVVPGCGAAYSLLGSSLLPALSAYSLKPLLALPGCAPAGRAPCMPPAFSRFQAPGRAQCPRPYPRPLCARAPVPSFFAVQCAKCCISNFLVLILRKN